MLCTGNHSNFCFDTMWQQDSPVIALPQMSRPVSAKGIQAACNKNIDSNDSCATQATSSGQTSTLTCIKNTCNTTSSPAPLHADSESSGRLARHNQQGYKLHACLMRSSSRMVLKRLCCALVMLLHKHEHQQVEDVGDGALPQWGSSPQSKSSHHVLHAVTLDTYLPIGCVVPLNSCFESNKFESAATPYCNV